MNNRFWSNISWLLLEKFLRFFSVLLVSSLVARHLGPESYGVLNYAISFSGLFLVFTSLGLDTVLVKELVKKHTPHKEILGTAFIMKLAGSILAIVGMTFYVLFSEIGYKEKYSIIVISGIFLFQASGVIDFYFQSKILSKYVVFAQLIQVTISTISKLFLLYINASYYYFPFIWLVDSLVLSVGLFYFYSKSDLSILNWKFNMRFCKKILKISWPLLLANLGFSIYMKIDQVMITEMIGAESNGFYSLAVRLSTVWGFIPAIIMNTFFPVLIDSRKNGIVFFLKKSQKLIDLLVLFSMLLGVLTTIFSDWLVICIAGKDFSYSSEILCVHIWTILFVSLNIFRSKLLIINDLNRFILIFSLIGATINVVLNLYFIKLFGALGAAYSTLISQMFASYLLLAFNRQTYYIFKLQTKSMLKNFLLIFPFHLGKEVLQEKGKIKF